MNRIVIIGGMGPQASLELHRRIIYGAAKAGAINNEDYPEIVHISSPVPDFISSENEDVAFQRLCNSLDGVHFRGDDKIVISCNTAHLLIPKIKKRYGVEIISLIQAVVSSVLNNQFSAVGLLASPMTVSKHLYSHSLEASGIKVINPNLKEMLELENAIRHVIANKDPRIVSPLIAGMVSRLKHDGAVAVVLGCTELSIIYNRGSKRKDLIDPVNEVLREIF